MKKPCVSGTANFLPFGCFPSFILVQHIPTSRITELCHINPSFVPLNNAGEGKAGIMHKPKEADDLLQATKDVCDKRAAQYDK